MTTDSTPSPRPAALVADDAVPKKRRRAKSPPFRVLGMGAWAKIQAGPTPEQFAIIDAEDLDLAAGKAWHTDDRGYIHCFTSEGRMSLHRVVMKAGPGQIVDHINGDSSDCRKANLRFVTKSQNGFHRVTLAANNTSGVHGVQLEGKRYRAMIEVDGKCLYFGAYDTIEEAAASRRTADMLLLGKYAPITEKRQRSRG